MIVAVLLEFVDCFLGVVGGGHHAEVFPVELLAGADVETEKIWMDCDSVFEAQGVFVAVGDSKAFESVGYEDLGF